jgi:hypothetical protein
MGVTAAAVLDAFAAPVKCLLYCIFTFTLFTFSLYR